MPVLASYGNHQALKGYQFSNNSWVHSLIFLNFSGDRVAEINSVPIEGFTRQQATDLLKNSAASATFVLERYKQSSKSVANTVIIFFILVLLDSKDLWKEIGS